MIVVARTGDEGTHDDVSLIRIPDPQDVDGIEFVRDIPCMEGDATIESEVHYDSARVPAENIIGEPGQGFRYIMESLDIGRIGAAAQGVGLLRERWKPVSSSRTNASSSTNPFVPIRAYRSSWRI